MIASPPVLRRGFTVLVGPHGAGKSTLGRALAARRGVVFEDEIGARLRAESLARDPSLHAMCAQPEFDARVFREEIARDARHLPGACRVVETWHPGNFAYAAARSRETVTAWRSTLESWVTPWRPHVVVQPLTITRETARRRLREPGPGDDALLEFFAQVGHAAIQRALAFGLHVLPALATDDVGVDTLVELVQANAWQTRAWR